MKIINPEDFKKVICDGNKRVALIKDGNVISRGNNTSLWKPVTHDGFFVELVLRGGIFAAATEDYKNIICLRKNDAEWHKCIFLS